MIGKLVKERRLELGLTQEELAKRMGYKHKSSINKIEMDINDVNQSNLIKLANALECSPAYFIRSESATNDATVVDIVKKANLLSPENKQNILQYIEYLLMKEGKK